MFIYDVTYVIRLEVRKGDRMSAKELKVSIVEGIPPLMDIVCADPGLCFEDDLGNIYVNPTSRMALKTSCSFEDGSNCKPEMTYAWDVYDENGTLIPDGTMAAYTEATGRNLISFAVSKEFFNASMAGTEDRLQIGLVAENGDGVKGKKISLQK